MAVTLPLLRSLHGSYVLFMSQGVRILLLLSQFLAWQSHRAVSLLGRSTGAARTDIPTARWADLAFSTDKGTVAIPAPLYPWGVHSGIEVRGHVGQYSCLSWFFRHFIGIG
jgi:hypothetical protein